MGIDSLSHGISGIVSAAKANPITTAVALGAGAAVIGGTTALLVSTSKKKRSSKNRNSRKKNRRIKHTRRGWKQDRLRRSKQKWEVAYQKRKRKHRSKSRRGIHYTKKGQPYKILPNGRARFIKKMKGGRR